MKIEEKIKLTPEQKYSLLNFHPSRLQEEIKRWLTEENCSALILTGERTIGRSYLLEAACFEQNFQGKPFVVASVDWSRITSKDPEDSKAYLSEQLKNQISDEHQKKNWQQMIKETFAIGVRLPILAYLGITLTIKLAGTLEFARELLTKCRTKLLSKKPADEYTALRRLLEALSKKHHLILHVCGAELLSIIDPEQLHDLCKALDKKYWRLQESADPPGRLLLAFSTTEPFKGNGEFSPLATLQEKRKLEVKPLNFYLLNEAIDTCFHPNLFGNGLTNPFSAMGLKQFISRFSQLNPFNKQFINFLHDYARKQENDEFCYPSFLADVCAELLHKKLLIRGKKYWQLSPDATGEELNAILGARPRSWNNELIKQLDKDYQPVVKLFFELAALCDPEIPCHLLLEWVCCEQQVDKKKLLERVHTQFLNDSALLKKKTGILWCFANPLLAVALRPINSSQMAADLLEWLQPRLPVSNRRYAGLYLRLAQYAGNEQYDEWRQRLNWWIEEDYSPILQLWLEGQLAEHNLQVSLLLKVVSHNIMVWPLVRIQAVMEACNTYYQTEDGIPLSMKGAWFSSLMGLLRFRQGRHDEALSHHEQALEIMEQALPEGHPDIAISHNNIGSVLHSMGRHDEALIRLQQVSKNHVQFKRKTSNQNQNIPNYRDVDTNSTVAAQKNFHHVENTLRRNSLCPCGSGKKYKQCHGKL